MQSPLFLRMILAKAPFLLVKGDFNKIELAPSKKGLEYEGECLQLKEWLYAYSLKKYLTPSISLRGYPPFTQEVLLEMQKIPFGEVKTYQELALLAGSPRAARAVGTVCRKNALPLIFPCHRVIAHSGMGNFAFGMDVKKILLDFENS